MRIFVLHNRCAGNDPPQTAYLSQLPDQLIGHPIDEIFLRLVPREVFKRQDRNGIDRLRGAFEKGERQDSHNDDQTSCTCIKDGPLFLAQLFFPEPGLYLFRHYAS